MTILKMEAVAGGYGPVKVLFGVNLNVEEGEIVALMGRNGMGKTTTIRMLAGALRPDSGAITFMGQAVPALPDFKIARLGMGLVPEGRQVFPNLTTNEHLVIAERSTAPARYWTPRRVFDLFPRLWERRQVLAGTLSGGEQQMLAIGRALVGNPRLLILDEATEGLAPVVRQEIWACFKQIVQSGTSIVVVDRDLATLSTLARRVFVLVKGATVYSGLTKDLHESEELRQKYLGV